MQSLAFLERKKLLLNSGLACCKPKLLNKQKKLFDSGLANLSRYF